MNATQVMERLAELPENIFDVETAIVNGDVQMREIDRHLAELEDSLTIAKLNAELRGNIGSNAEARKKSMAAEVAGDPDYQRIRADIAARLASKSDAESDLARRKAHKNFLCREFAAALAATELIAAQMNLAAKNKQNERNENV